MPVAQQQAQQVPQQAQAVPQQATASESQQHPAAATAAAPAPQQQAQPAAASAMEGPPHHSSGGILDMIRRKVREAASRQAPIDPFFYSRYGPGVMPPPPMTPYGYPPQAPMMMPSANDYFAAAAAAAAQQQQQQQAAMMQPDPMMMGAYGAAAAAAMNPAMQVPMMQQQPLMNPMAQPTTPYGMPFQQPYGLYQQPTPFTPGGGLMNPYTQQLFGQPQPMMPQPYGMMMPGQQPPYDYFGAAAAPQPLGYPYDPYSAYQQQMPGYAGGFYNPMSIMYDPSYIRRLFPERNYISAVKDLWQSNIL